MKKLFMLLTMLAATTGWAFCQGTGEIWGRVVDSESGISLPGASVFTKTGNNVVGVHTDENGYFRLKGLAPGTYTVEYSYTGYGSGTLEKVSVFSDGITRTDDYALKAGVELTGAIIYGEKLIGMDVVPKMKQLDLARMPNHGNLKHLVSALTTDVMTTDDGALYFRGSRNNDYVYYVDGTKLAGDNFKVPSTAIGSIQVYSGGVPARYGDFTGGCIVIETQSYFNWLNSRN